MARNRIFLLGEAWGEREEAEGKPFVGTSGWLLRGMLSQIGISYDECYVSNVFNLRPKPSNDIKNLCGPKATALPGYPKLGTAGYIREEFRPELERLYAEIRHENPNVIVALGATAAWALLKSSGIKAIRGATTATHPDITAKLGRPFKVLPTLHPANIAREYTSRPIGLSDLSKAIDESTFLEVRRPAREIWLRPTLEDLARYEREYINPSPLISCDIETIGPQITCIGFAPSPESCIVIPFWSAGVADGNYWPTVDDERAAWAYVKRWCETKPLLMQNGMYDSGVLWRSYGIACNHMEHDTMLLHHAHQLEMQKGLGFLATLYTRESSWKFMRRTAEQKGHD